MRMRSILTAMLGAAALLALAPATEAHAQAARYTVHVEPDYIEVEPGAQIPFKAVLLRKGERTYSKHDWQWFAMNGGRFQQGQKTKLAQNIFLAPSKPGTYDIEVTTDRAARLGQKGKAQIVVKAKAAAPAHEHYLRIVPDAVQIAPGQRAIFQAEFCGCIRRGGVRWGGQGGSFRGAAYYAGNTPGRYEIWAQAKQWRAKAWVEIAAPLHCARIAISPESHTLYPGESVRFGAQAWDQYGNEFAGATWAWGAGGGTLRGNLYTAGDTPGRYKVAVRELSSNAVKVAWVTIKSNAQLATIGMDPLNAELKCGESLQFRAAGFDQWKNPYDNVKWEWGASGGTITAGGVYTAGNTPGRYRVTVFDHVSNKAVFTWVTIKPSGAAHIVLGPRISRIGRHEKVQLTLEFFDERLNAAAASSVSFGMDGGWIDANGWWHPRDCQPGRIYKIWAVDDTTGARDEVLIYVRRGKRPYGGR